MLKKKAVLFSFPFLFLIICVNNVHATALLHEDVPTDQGPLVKKDERRSLVSTEYGEISAVEISDGERGSYHLQFITLEPNSLFLPVLLHADMVFYVHTGSGRLTWADEDEKRRLNLRRGDVYRLKTGTVFSLQSDLQPERQKLRIYAIFANSADDLHQPSIGVYSSIRDMLIGFDKRVLQAAFQVPEEMIEEIINGTQQPAIVHGVPEKERTLWEWKLVQLMKGILGSKGYSLFDVNNKKEKTRTFNILNANPDFENCNGWSLTVTKKNLKALKGSKFGLFMVNLTKGSMMGPHWNPMATEITIVVEGQGMVRVVCSSTAKESECKNMRFRVEEGDVFVVPRFHPMAQMAFNNDSFVFMGFSTATKKNHPQFLAGKASVFHTLDKEVLAASFNVTNTTIDQLLAPAVESIILECTSCAEEEERIMEEEIERERQEAREREEEEARKREEEKRREEEEARKREEEEARKREEEKKREEEEEEARRKEEEEKARKREEEEARKREEEKKREEEEEEARRKEEEEEARKREEEEEEARRREEEEAKREEEDEARRREEEEARQEEEEEEARRREEEEASRREEEKARKREEQREQEEEQGREEEAAQREEEEARRQEEAAARRQQEEEARRREEEEEEAAAARREEQEGERREREGEDEARGSKETEKEEREIGNGSYGEGRVLKKIWKV